MLTAVELAAAHGCLTISRVKSVLQEGKRRIRDEHKFYSQDLINHLFSHPYTNIDLLMETLNVSRLTATKYLDELAASGVLYKVRLGRTNYYINNPLRNILADKDKQNETT